jgi:uncharacterized protein YjiS (DUF1127 family)
MILTGKRPSGPFGASPYGHFHESFAARAGSFMTGCLRRMLQPSKRQRRIRKTVVELSKLNNHALRDLGLDRSAIIGVAQGAETGLLDDRRRFRR